MKINAVGNMLTERCTLRCRYCNASMPYIDRPKTFGAELLKRTISRVFECFEHVDEFGFYGGEAFLHPDLTELIEFASRYRDQMSIFVLMTNATVEPSVKTLEALMPFGDKYRVHVDDYGAASGKLGTVLDLLDRHNINTRLVHYNEKEQYCGGWVDFGNNYEYKNYTRDELRQVFERCHSRDRCYVTWGGGLHQCAFHAAGVRRGLVPEVEGDCVDLLSDLSASQILERTEALSTRIVEGCKYCNGFDVEGGKRVMAGEQLEKRPHDDI